MNHRIKLFVGFLAFTAVISVFSFFDIFNVARSLIAVDENKPLAAPDEDVDHDGLMNADESYWNTDLNNPDSDGDGFLDGEEVLSSHDPNLAGPNDSLLNINLTEKVANLALAGLMEGSLKIDNSSFEESVDTVALSVVDDGIASFVPTQDISKIRLVEFSKESQEIYFKQIEPILELFLKTLGLEATGLDTKLSLIESGGMSNPEFVQYFSLRREEYNLIAKEWLEITVPKNWFTEHIRILDIIGGLAEINDALAGGGDDPLRAMVGFNLFLKMLEEDIPSILDAYSQRAKAENIPTNLF